MVRGVLRGARGFACGLSLVVLIMIVCTALGHSARAAEDLAASYGLGPGDEVRVTVFNQPDMSGQFLIGADGMIALPLVGNIKAQGVSVRELETRIQDALRPDFLKNPAVNVEVLNYRPFYILGEVYKPGSFPYVSGMRVVNAVALAGGYTARASKEGIFIERAGSKERIKANSQTLVLPGDVIHVQERFF